MIAELTAIVLSLVGGARYGAKIRFPHALVMATLFRTRSESVVSLIRKVCKVTVEHSKNLAIFATVYKLVLAILKHGVRLIDSKASAVLRGTAAGWVLPMLVQQERNKAPIHQIPPAPGLPEHPIHSFVAGAVGGYLVWGRYSSVNYQILLYLSSRVALGVWKRSQLRLPQVVEPHSYPLFAALIWGTVMYLFEESPGVLHASLKRSMDEIYRYQVGHTAT